MPQRVLGRSRFEIWCFCRGWAVVLVLAGCILSIVAHAEGEGTLEGTPEGTTEGQVEFPPCTETVLLEPGLDDGNVNDAWVESVTNTFSPLCTLDNCGTLEQHGPYSGQGWAWFGGPQRDDRASVSAITQTLFLPRGDSGVLRFHAYIPRPSGAFGDVFQVFLDSTLLFQLDHTETLYYDRYIPIEVAIDRFADGRVHTLKFISVIFAYRDGAVFLDDLCIQIAPPTGEGEGEGTPDGEPEGEGEGAAEGEGEGEGEGEVEGEEEGEGEPNFDVLRVTTLDDSYDIDESTVRSIGFDPGPDGVLSLREAIASAGIHYGADTIRFDVSGTVSPESPLPEIDDVTGGVDIDGEGRIILNGAVLAAQEACPSEGGLVIRSGGNRIAGLTVTGFCRSGIYVHGVIASDNAIENCSSANPATGVGNAIAAVEIDNAPGNQVGPGNVFNGNEYGVFLSGIGAFENRVSANRLGVDPSGTLVRGNLMAGVLIAFGAGSNIIGGSTRAERNIISGNGNSGVILKDYLTEGNVVSGNYIGVDASGAVALPNKFDGVQIQEGASRNLIGGNTPGRRNIISGNGADGVNIINYGAGFQVFANQIAGNYIGTDATGSVAIPNGIYGVEIAGINPINGNLVGGAGPGEGNLISGNAVRGVRFGSIGTQNNLVYGNTIGLDATGITSLPNGDAGILLSNSCRGNFIGGAEPGQANFITGNTSVGILIAGGDTTGNTIKGNYIGMNRQGAILGNGFAGVEIFVGAHVIGGPAEGEGNVICGHTGNGIYLAESGTVRNTMRHNRIFQNARQGIRLHRHANADILPPVITRIGPIQGYTVPRGVLDFFADTEDEGRYFVGEATANGDGVFIINLDLAPYGGLNLTATVTDPSGNSSAFSGVYNLPGDPEGTLEEGLFEGLFEGSPDGEGTTEGAVEGEGEAEGEGSVEGEFSPYHTADTDRDHRFSLDELLRVIQIYNSLEFHCEAGTEDGYATGPGDHNCTRYAADYLPQDWSINLDELLRVIQFYNSLAYRACPDDPSSEDGYCAGA
jgi:hypothetical protein